MYKQVHNQKNTVEITLTKALTAIVTVFVFLVIPIQVTILIKQDLSKKNASEIVATAETSGSVAGASTSKEDKGNVLGISIKKENESDVYIGIGAALIVISVALLLVLYKDTKTSKGQYETNLLEDAWSY